MQFSHSPRRRSTQLWNLKPDGYQMQKLVISWECKVCTEAFAPSEEAEGQTGLQSSCKDISETARRLLQFFF